MASKPVVLGKRPVGPIKIKEPPAKKMRFADIEASVSDDEESGVESDCEINPSQTSSSSAAEIVDPEMYLAMIRKGEEGLKALRQEQSRDLKDYHAREQEDSGWVDVETVIDALSEPFQKEMRNTFLVTITFNNVSINDQELSSFGDVLAHPACQLRDTALASFLKVPFNPSERKSGMKRLFTATPSKKASSPDPSAAYEVIQRVTVKKKWERSPTKDLLHVHMIVTIDYLVGHGCYFLINLKRWEKVFTDMNDEFNLHVDYVIPQEFFMSKYLDCPDSLKRADKYVEKMYEDRLTGVTGKKNTKK